MIWKKETGPHIHQDFKRKVNFMMKRLLSEFFHSMERNLDPAVCKEVEIVFKEVEGLQKKNTLADLRQANRLLNELDSKYPSTFNLARNYRGEIGLALVNAVREQQSIQQPNP
jgi:hypothetical protein